MDLALPDTRGLPRAAARALPGAVALVLLGLLASGAAGQSPVRERTLRPARGPGVPAADLQYFRLEPASRDSVYRLLAIPVRFPEDAALGAEPGELDALLNGEAVSSLRGYYRAATGGRLRIESTVAPTVVADHSRAFYTVEGDGNLGYGLDPNAYPHNARFLVEEVTAKLQFAIDFTVYDNTGDGIVDGLLLLHSGPEAPEIPESGLPRDHLLAHAFTLEAPVSRGGAEVFPYAVAATRDPVGPLAHETGHLFGLPDLYVANGFCPGPGVGDWSLMATGAVRPGGGPPAGLDAFSRQLLGIVPTTTVGAPVVLEEGEALRVFRRGETPGAEYFLVERRTGEDGLGLDAPAVLVYHVDEDAGDNRSCSGARLVRVRAVVCEGTGGCSLTLDDSTTPNLRDGDGNPTGLVLRFDVAGRVTARHQGLPMLRLDRVRLLEPRIPAGEPEQQPIEVTVSNLDPAGTRSATLQVEHLGFGSTAPRLLQPDWIRLLPPGVTLVDTSWVVVAIPSGDPLPSVVEPYVFTLLETGTVFSRADTVDLPVDRQGLGPEELPAFVPVNLAPGRDDPWSGGGGEWTAGDLSPFAASELRSPWFTVPGDGRLVLDHEWSLEALSPDVALDAAQIRLRRPLASDVILTPPLGWGFTAERMTGNALAGQEVLAGNGARIHVLDLADHAGDIVQIALRVAGDVEGGGGPWRVHEVSVQEASAVSFRVEQHPFSERTLVAATDSPSGDPVVLTLYRGAIPVTPVQPVASVVWPGTPSTELATVAGTEGRFELVWRDTAGRAGADAVRFRFATPSQGVAFLYPPSPNPLRRGNSQDWRLRLADDVPGGSYRLALTNLAGREIRSFSIRVDRPGIRSVSWDGRDRAGREVAGGVYFLHVHRPDGKSESRRVVVIP